ncbi:MAG: group II intron reverse transcriptase/maturase [Chitinivibrionales bacterium]|nr:group II intron reverse transcriptase/maturase [Chitinivibrionales bacterium]MBD3356586.1 group II intron reverse transcriptase/maturase [Chitinivibrionales bacterium]
MDGRRERRPGGCEAGCGAQTSLDAIAQSARRNKKKRYRSLYSFLNHVCLERAYHALNKRAAAGVDRVSWNDYGENLKENLLDLEERLKTKRYRAKWVRRVFIPKGNDKVRPLSIPAIEDKIVQYVVKEILEALFEALFLDTSFGYRKKRSPRQAVERLRDELNQKCTWVVEADISSFFDTIDRDWLVKMLERRVNDRSLIRLIEKWLRAGVLQPDGSVNHPERGTAQGSTLSPVPANIYLHFVLDQWFSHEMGSIFTGRAVLVKYADDFVAGFRYHTVASRFLRALKQRLEKFGLSLAPEKTRKFMFNRFNLERSETFEFLGFEYRRSVARSGRDYMSLRTSRKKLRKITAQFTEWCKGVRNKRLRWIMPMVKSKLTELKNYFGVGGNWRSIREIRMIFKRILFKWLNRRSERKSFNWSTFDGMLRFYNVLGYEHIRNEGVQLSFLSKPA